MAAVAVGIVGGAGAGSAQPPGKPREAASAVATAAIEYGQEVHPV